MQNLIIGFILGTILGSFAKALADRSLKGKSFFGRSYCPDCKHKLAWYDLLPLVSYVLLQGKCRYCKKRISLEYVVAELVMGILIGFLFWQSFQNFLASCHPELVSGSFEILKPFNFIQGKQVQNDAQCIISADQFKLVAFFFDLLFKTFFITVLIIVTLTDLKKTLIPDRIIIPGIWIALVSLSVFTIYRVGYLYYYLNQTPLGKLLLPPESDYFTRHAIYTFQDVLLGGVLTGAGIAAFFMALIIITKGKGMGGGDVKLGGFMGLALGFPNGVLAVILGFLTGAVSAVFLILIKKKHFGENIPFGPFLVVGSLIALFWGTEIINWYLSLSK